MKIYTCESCHLAFNSETPYEEAMKEYINSAKYDPKHDTAVICDDCFKEFNEWYDSLTEDDHKRILGTKSDY